MKIRSNKFKINNVEYTIKEVSQQEYKELRVKEDEEDYFKDKVK